MGFMGLAFLFVPWEKHYFRLFASKLFYLKFSSLQRNSGPTPQN